MIRDFPTTDHAFIDTPEFYKRIIGSSPPIDPRIGGQIATGIELEALVVLVGSYPLLIK
jgi:hypothetical protein